MLHINICKAVFGPTQPHIDLVISECSKSTRDCVEFLLNGVYKSNRTSSNLRLCFHMFAAYRY